MIKTLSKLLKSGLSLDKMLVGECFLLISFIIKFIIEFISGKIREILSLLRIAFGMRFI